MMSYVNKQIRPSTLFPHANVNALVTVNAHAAVNALVTVNSAAMAKAVFAVSIAAAGTDLTVAKKKKERNDE